MRWTEALNIAGSIASISGVTLLWLRAAMPEVTAPGLIGGFVATVAGALISIGLIALAIEFLSRGEKMSIVSTSQRTRIIYWTFSSAVVLVVVATLLILIWTVVWGVWHIH